MGTETCAEDLQKLIERHKQDPNGFSFWLFVCNEKSHQLDEITGHKVSVEVLLDAFTALSKELNAEGYLTAIRRGTPAS